MSDFIAQFNLVSSFWEKERTVISKKKSELAPSLNNNFQQELCVLLDSIEQSSENTLFSQNRDSFSQDRETALIY